jgi:hypothetical protein
LREQLPNYKKDPKTFPNAIATMFCYITEDRNRADRVVEDMLLKAIKRPGDDLRKRLLIGPAEECIMKLSAYQKAGAQMVFLWPIADPITDEPQQLELFHRSVAEKL